MYLKKLPKRLAREKLTALLSDFGFHLDSELLSDLLSVLVQVAAIV
jgi:hypothetical protein